MRNSPERSLYHVVPRWSSENADGWYFRVGVRFKDGLRAPGCLLCTFLGNNFLRVSIFISLRRISDTKGPAPLGLGLGKSEAGKLNQEAGEGPGVKGS